jgi:hypothetical protein
VPRELGQFPPIAAQLLLRLPREQIWKILQALQNLCDDPSLLALHEEDGENFIVDSGYAIFLDVDDATVTVLMLRKISTN